MRCPNCGFADSKVVDSRPIEEGNSIRRRRECLSCQKRFTTFEVLESVQILVVKKDGTKELFDRSKMLSGIMKACQKRPVNGEEIAAEIEAELQNDLVQEISSRKLGEMIMRKLKQRDDVAYVRFASVYREFKDVDTFLDELNRMIRKDSSTKSKKEK
jgi:transcriptional repressor NrdR